jgi:hypothetical protein
VAVGFADPVHGAALLLQRLDRLRAARDEDRVEHGAAHALEVVVGLDALGAAVLVLARGVDGRAAGADGVRQGAGALESADHGVVGDRVVAVGDHDGDAASLDGRLGGHEVSLAETLGGLAVVGAAFLLGDLVGADELCDLLGEAKVDVAQALGHLVVDPRVVTVVKLEGERCGQVSLLVLCKRVVEELGLVVVLAELLRAQTSLHALNLCGDVLVGAVLDLCRWGSLEAVRPVVDSALSDSMAHGTVAVLVHDRADGLVDGQLLPVGTETAELSVGVGEVAALQQRVVGESNTGDDVTSAEGDLLGLGEVLVDVAVQFVLTHVVDGNQLLWPDLGGIKGIELELVLVCLGKDLNTKVPLGEGSVVNGLVEVLSVEIGVLASKLESLVPDEAVNTKAWLEVELDKEALALGVVESEGVDTETLHHAVGSGNTTVGVCPHEHVGGLGVKVLEVPEVVVSCEMMISGCSLKDFLSMRHTSLCLGDLVVRLRLAGVDDIGELDRILNEENGNVVSAIR